MAAVKRKAQTQVAKDTNTETLPVTSVDETMRTAPQKKLRLTNTDTCKPFVSCRFKMNHQPRLIQPLGLLRVHTLSGGAPSSAVAKVIRLTPGKYLGRNPKGTPVNTTTHIDIGITMQNGPEVSRKQLVVLSVDSSRVILQANPKAANSIEYQRSRSAERQTLTQGAKLSLRAMDCIFLPSCKNELSNVFMVHPVLTKRIRTQPNSALPLKLERNIPRCSSSTSDGSWRPKCIGVNPCGNAQLEMWNRASVPPALSHRLRDRAELHASLANTIRKALNSAEPHVGSALMSALMDVHRQVPNRHLFGELVEVLCHGPKDGDETFPDCHRVALVASFVDRILRHCDTSHKLAMAATNEFFKESLQRLSSTMSYCAVGDEDREDSAEAVLRVAQSIYVHASSTKLLADLLPGLFKSSLDRSVPIVGEILRFGVARAVKHTIDVMVGAWIRHGDYVFEHSSSEYRSCRMCSSIPKDLYLFVFTETKLVFHCLGVIASYLMRLCEAEDPCQNAMNKAYLIRDSVDRQVEIVNRGTKSENSIFWKELKLGMITSFDDALVPGLKKDLAKLWRVG